MGKKEQIRFASHFNIALQEGVGESLYIHLCKVTSNTRPSINIYMHMGFSLKINERNPFRMAPLTLQQKLNLQKKKKFLYQEFATMVFIALNTCSL